MSDQKTRDRPTLTQWLKWYGPSTAGMLTLATVLGLLSIYAAQTAAR